MKIKTADLTGAALDWAVAKCEGRVLVEPEPASYVKVRGLRIPFQLWDVVCTYRNDVLVSAAPMPIRVDRCGIDHTVGATAPSITFSGGIDRNARGSVDMFYMTEDDARTAAVLMLKGGLDDFSPSTTWSLAGPIIERECLQLWKDDCSRDWLAAPFGADDSERDYDAGPTPLIAAMRCFVASRMGDEADVPAELWR